MCPELVSCMATAVLVTVVGQCGALLWGRLSAGSVEAAQVDVRSAGGRSSSQCSAGSRCSCAAACLSLWCLSLIRLKL